MHKTQATAQWIKVCTNLKEWLRNNTEWIGGHWPGKAVAKQCHWRLLFTHYWSLTIHYIMCWTDSFFLICYMSLFWWNRSYGLALNEGRPPPPPHRSTTTQRHHHYHTHHHSHNLLFRGYKRYQLTYCSCVCWSNLWKKKITTLVSQENNKGKLTGEKTCTSNDDKCIIADTIFSKAFVTKFGEKYYERCPNILLLLAQRSDSQPDMMWVTREAQQLWRLPCLLD